MKYSILFTVLVCFGTLIAQNEDYQIAKNQFEKGDIQESIKSYTISISKDEDYRSHMGRAKSYIALKKYDDAIKDYSIAIEISPEDSRIYYNRGNCFLEMKEEQAAFADFNKAIDLDPANFHAYNSRGYIYFSKDSLEKAEEDYLRSISLNLNYRIAYVNLADLYVKQGKYDVAKELIADYLQYNTEDYVAYAYLGNLYYDEGNYELASKFLGTSLSFELNQPEIIETVASILVVQLKEYEYAISFILKAQEVYSSALLEYLLGMSYLTKSNFSLANEMFMEVLKNRKKGEYDNTELLVVTCLAELGENEKAILMLDSLEKLSYKLPEVYLQKSLLYLNNEDYKRSLNYLDLAIDQKPLTTTLLQKGYLLRKTGKLKQALAHYNDMDTSVDFKKEIYEAKSNLFLEMNQKDSACSCLYRTVIFGNMDKAQSYLTDCQSELDSNKVKVLKILSLMNVYNKKGVSYKDLNDFNTLIELEPRVYDFYLWRGIYLKSKKKYSEAISDFSHCIALKPNQFEGYYFASNSMLDKGDTTSFLTTITLGIHKTKSLELLYSRALFYKRIGDIEYSFKDLKEIITISPSYSNAYYQLGLLFSKEKDLEKACKYFKQAILLGNSKARLEYKISCQ
jgi:tetratricopeptide (TPR) repeat protein